jgi:hypothetical protein
MEAGKISANKEEWGRKKRDSQLFPYFVLLAKHGIDIRIRMALLLIAYSLDC